MMGTNSNAHPHRSALWVSHSVTGYHTRWDKYLLAKLVIVHTNEDDQACIIPLEFRLCVKQKRIFQSKAKRMGFVAS